MRCHESIFRILCLLVVLLGVQGTENELAERAVPSPDPCQRHRSGMLIC